MYRSPARTLAIAKSYGVTVTLVDTVLPARVPETVTTVCEETLACVTLNDALDLPAGTVTEGGTVTAEFIRAG